MAGAGERTPRTVLEHLLWQQDRTYEELAHDFANLARAIGERATISPRHLARLARGERDGAGTTPTTRRVLHKMFGRSADELLRPWAPANETEIPSPIAASSPILPGGAGAERGILAMAAQRARKFAIIAGQSAVSADVIDQLHDDVHRLAVAYPQRPLRSGSEHSAP